MPTHAHLLTMLLHTSAWDPEPEQPEWDFTTWLTPWLPQTIPGIQIAIPALKNPEGQTLYHWVLITLPTEETTDQLLDKIYDTDDTAYQHYDVGVTLPETVDNEALQIELAFTLPPIHEDSDARHLSTGMLDLTEAVIELASRLKTVHT